MATAAAPAADSKGKWNPKFDRVFETYDEMKAKSEGKLVKYEA